MATGTVAAGLAQFGDLAQDLPGLTDEQKIAAIAAAYDGWRYNWKKATEAFEAARAQGKLPYSAPFMWKAIIQYPWWAYRFATEVREVTEEQREEIEALLSGREGDLSWGVTVPSADHKGRPSPTPGIAYLYAKNVKKGRWEPGEYLLKLGSQQGQPEWEEKYKAFLAAGTGAPGGKGSDGEVRPQPLKPDEKPDEKPEGKSILPYVLGAAVIGGLVWYFLIRDGEAAEFEGEF